MDNVQDTLKERGDRYGDFTDHAIITDGLLEVMYKAPGWKKLPPFMKQALRTIADKIARILNGDPHYTDNWHDIQGYAKLVEDRCDTSDPNQYPLLDTHTKDAPYSVRLVLNNGTTLSNVSSDDLELCPIVDCVQYEGKTFKHSKSTGGYHEVVDDK